MKITIHQPNFFPHKSLFDKIAMADKFVFLTHCQFEKNGYQNRFQFNDKWHTMRVAKKPKCLLSEKTYLYPDEDWAKIKKSFPDIDFSSWPEPTCDLSYSNTRMIKYLALLFKIPTKIYYDYPTNLTASRRLVDICKHYECDTYISGPSGKNYLDLKLFDEAGIKIEYQEPCKSTPILKHIRMKGI